MISAGTEMLLFGTLSIALNISVFIRLKTIILKTFRTANPVLIKHQENSILMKHPVSYELYIAYKPLTIVPHVPSICRLDQRQELLS